MKRFNGWFIPIQMKLGCSLIISLFYSFLLLGELSCPIPRDGSMDHRNPSILGHWLVQRAMKKDDDRDPLQKEHRKDEKTQLIVGCIGSAADIIEFVSETVGDQPGDLCNSKLHLILWLCWSLRKNLYTLVIYIHCTYLRHSREHSDAMFTFTCMQSELSRIYWWIFQSLFQFIFSFAPYSNRIRPDAERVGHFLMQSEVWSILILLGFQEIPFLFSRHGYNHRKCTV